MDPADNNIFWSNQINVGSSNPVISLMQQQANALGRITKNVVEAKINTSITVDEGSGFMEAPRYLHCFDIIAPLIGYQSFTLFCVKQIVGVDFPLTISSAYWGNTDNDCECADIAKFKDCLIKILTSAKTIKLINSILATSNDVAK